MEFAEFVAALRHWAENRTDIRAVGIAGSHARGAARPDSDIDVLLLTTNPRPYLANQGWLGHFGSVRTCQQEDWGAVQSLRTFYADGTEVEFGITTPAWASIDPLDPGTREVVQGGFMAVVEHDHLLANLIDACSS